MLFDHGVGRSAVPVGGALLPSLLCTWSMISWKWTVTLAHSQLRWLVELWISSEILLNLSWGVMGGNAIR